MIAVPRSRHVYVHGEAGRLESVIEQAAQSRPRAVAVICHPHPLHGGSMDNKVVTTLSRTLSRQGALAIRFNYRGVGASEGGYDHGEGELADALAIADWALDEFGKDLPLVLAGFSFGGAIAYRAAAVRRTRALITVAPASERIPEQTPEPDCDWLLIQGTADEIVSPMAVQEWIGTRVRRPEQVWLPDVGHFFHGQLGALSAAVKAFAALDRVAA